ncbi:MAG: PIG-L family deacetylase [Asgard group archaeon]|nr:PIG-L family deacetylase [Asgard group archaeon]
MTEEKKTIFACFAHPDDEISSIGSLCNHVDRGDRVVLAWTTSGEMASHFNGMEFDEVKKIREEQGREVGEIVGCETLFLDYGDTHVRSTRENALKMTKVVAEIKPDAVITWSLNTRHPDHRGTAQIICDAITYARIPHITGSIAPHRPPLHIPMFLYYEEFSTLPVIYIDISKNFEKVQKVAKLYGDFYKWERVNDWINTMKHADGLRCGVGYAEKFNVLTRYLSVEQYLPINNDNR